MPDDQTLPPVIARQRSLSIKGLTARLPERGRLKIGMRGDVTRSKNGTDFQRPVKLDHFLITTLERGKDNNFIRDDELHALFTDEPTEIPVRLLYDDIALNFPTRYAAYDGRKQWCSGDGETAIRMDGRDGAPRQVQCTCPLQEPEYTGAKKCKMNGALSVLIDGVPAVGGVWTFRTTSYNSVVGLMSSMAFIKGVTGGVLANIPLTLAVRPKQATDPSGTPQTIYVVGLEFRGNIEELQQIGHKIALDRATTHLSIEHIQDEARRVLLLEAPSNAPLPGDDPDDVAEEFYPDEVVNAPPRPTRAQFTGAVIEGEVLAPGDGEAAAEESEPETSFNADEYEAGYLGQLGRANTPAACKALLDTEHDDLFRLDQETRERLIRKTNAKWGDLDEAANPKPAKKAAKAPSPSLSVPAEGAAAVEEAKASEPPAATRQPGQPTLTQEAWEALGGALIDAAKDCLTQRDLSEEMQGGKFTRYAEMKDAAPAVYAAVDRFIDAQRKRLPV